MSPKVLNHIPKAPLEALIQKPWSTQPRLRAFRFADGDTMKTLVEAVDLRIDVHAHPDDPTVATAKIQPNAQAKDRAIQDLIESATKGPHQGTHQVFRTFKMGLGLRFPSMEVFEDAIRGKCTEAFAAEPPSKSSAAPPGWFFDKDQNNFYRMTPEGKSYFEPPPEAQEGMWVKEFGRLLYIKPDGKYEWKPQPE